MTPYQMKEKIITPLLDEKKIMTPTKIVTPMPIEYG